MKKRTLGYCPVGHSRSPLELVFENVVNVQQVMAGYSDVKMEDLDAVVFWGGTDIHPSIYGQARHPLSQAPKNVSERDVFELTVMSRCKQMGIPMIGVCRGAQLMCAFAGGSLVQHCNGHSGSHDMRVEVFPNVFEVMETTSSHHQMMNPSGTKHKVIATAWGPDHRSQFYHGESAHDPVECMFDQGEPEIVYFPEIQGLAIQGHPEWVNIHHPFAEVCNKLIRQYLLTEEHEGTIQA